MLLARVEAWFSLAGAYAPLVRSSGERASPSRLTDIDRRQDAIEPLKIVVAMRPAAPADAAARARCTNVTPMSSRGPSRVQLFLTFCSLCA